MMVDRIASAVDTQLSIAKETEWGITPSNPVFKRTRITSESLTAGLTTVASQELRPDRNVSDLPLVAASASGGFNFEFSYSTFDDILAAVMFNDWVGNSVTNGKSEKQQSFTIEKRFDMKSGSYEYFRYAGMVPNTLSLTLGVDAIVTGSVEFMGKREEADTSPILGSTYINPTTNSVLNATRDFAMFSVGGDTQHFIQSIDMSISNNLRAQRAVAHLEGIGVGTGQFTVTGAMNVYFKTRALYDKYLKNESVALSFIMGEEGGKQYKFTLPKIKFSQGAINAEGIDGDLMCNMQYQALYDETIGGTLRIERAVGIPPAAVPATGIVLDMTSMNLSVGNSRTIVATVLPDSATNKGVTWSSDDPTVATVTNGVVTAVSVGDAVITATTASGANTATCDVEVG